MFSVFSNEILSFYDIFFAYKPHLVYLKPTSFYEATKCLWNEQIMTYGTSMNVVVREEIYRGGVGVGGGQVDWVK